METAEEAGLERLKKRMTPTQRKDMAELLANELRTREAAKKRQAVAGKGSTVRSSNMNSSLDRDEMRKLYADMHERMKKSKGKKRNKLAALAQALQSSQAAEAADGGVSVSLSSAVRPEPNVLPERSGFSGKHIFLLSSVIVIAVLKVLTSTGVVDASVSAHQSMKAPAITPQATLAQPADITPAPNNSSESVQEVQTPSFNVKAVLNRGNWSASEKTVLVELDARRVELEKRRVGLDKRAADLDLREKELSARVAELRTLTRKLKQFRKEKNHQHEARMEQLANVYGSMAPQEAAPLIAKLDDSIALALLKRLPGKRMGQVLSMMHDDRAIELTRMLSDRKR